MNNFAEIKPLFKYDKVAYYSLAIGGSSKTLFEEFKIKHQQGKNKDKFHHIIRWLQRIGRRYGAQTRFFRNEAFSADTSALPPTGKDRNPAYKVDGINTSNDLRLYCLRANENVVFLFGGDIKTTAKAQDCPNVQSHFFLANALTYAIDKAFKDKEIKWIEDYTLIKVDDNYKLIFEL